VPSARTWDMGEDGPDYLSPMGDKSKRRGRYGMTNQNDHDENDDLEILTPEQEAQEAKDI